MSAHYVTKEPVLWPQDEDVELAEQPCPNCSHDTFSALCSDCGGEGGHDAYEEDPNFYDPGDTLPCGLCHGEGVFHWCPRCNWDLNLPAKYNTPAHRGRAIALFDVRLTIRPQL